MVRTKLTEQEARQYGRSRSGLNTTYQRLQEELFRNKAELKALNAKEQTQNAQLAGYRQKLEKLNQIEVEVRGLQRQVDVDQQNYKLYLTKFEESRISNAMDSEKIINVTQILPATPPIKPVKPKVLLNLFLGIFLGAFGGLALAFFLEYLDDSITRPEEAEAFNLPVLATIPKLRLVAVPQTSRRKKVGAMPSGTSDFSVSVILGLAFTLSAFLGLWFYLGDPNISAPVRQKIAALDALPVIELSPIKADLQGTKAFSKQGVSEGKPQPNKTETGGTVNEIDKKAAQEKPMERLDPVPSTATKPSVTDRRIQMIQVGAFRNKEFALDQAAALQQKRYDARIVETKLDETGTIYRVRVLSYEDLGKPSVTINKLMNDGFDAFRVPGNQG
jgi:cell division septation protein DedD